LLSQIRNLVFHGSSAFMPSNISVICGTTLTISMMTMPPLSTVMMTG
jgi:hypothetical protein